MNIEDYLDSDRVKHSLNVKEKARVLLDKNGMFLKNRDEILKCAELHDIGYSKKIVKTGFHPLDGYIYLKNKVPIIISAGILLHTQADELSKFQDKAIKKLFDKEFQNINITNDIKVCISIVSLCDMLINQLGEPVTIEERYLQVESKYGATDYRSIIMKNSLKLYKKLNNSFR